MTRLHHSARMWAIFAYRLAMASVVILFFGCGGSRAVQESSRSLIRIKGSDTMLLLAQRWAEAFMREHPGTSISVEGGGTEIGIAAMIKGETEFCTASRPLSPEEISRIAREYRSLGFSVLTARDALCFYTHMDNPALSLTLDQLADIFRGQIRNWKDVGGDDALIVVLSRDPNSGTHGYLEDHVLRGGRIREDARILPGTAAIVREVSRNVHAIGYGGLAYGENVYDLDVDGVPPFPENVRNGTYPVSRYLYLYSVRPPEGMQKRFIDWILSPAGQRVVQEVGYVPLYDVPAR
ncbi:MAG: phosphate ABC transporter substrate-binding protein [Bacteroidota bacterium]